MKDDENTSGNKTEADPNEEKSSGSMLYPWEDFYTDSSKVIRPYRSNDASTEGNNLAKLVSAILKI